MRNRKFEAWFANRSKLPLADVQHMWTGKTYRSHSYRIELPWAAWCAALGFELPPIDTPDEEDE